MTTQVNLASDRVTTPLAGWWTLDRYAWPVNVTADMGALPFRSGSVDHIHFSHAIEHVPFELVPDVLDEVKRVMTPNGILYCSGPDMDRTRAVGSTEWMFYTERGGRRPGWGHAWTCGVKRLRKLLLEAGLSPTWCKSIPATWPPNTHAWPLDLEARFLCRHTEYQWPQQFPANFQVQT